MKYLIDTDVIINYLRAQQRLDKEILKEGAGISVITLGELIYGAYKSSSPKRSLNITLGFIKESTLQIIDLNQEMIFNFGQLKAGLEKLGQRLEDFDIFIAATAIVKDLILVTKNTKHFQRIPILKISK